MENPPKINDAQYVQGQIDGLKAIMLTLAQQMPREQFQRLFETRIEMTKIALLPLAVPESRFEGLDDIHLWMSSILA